ncbi:phosphatase PAP2 family protein [Biformimicrobium ophioploci]|uniref:undecaprenyl-diphosphate phosphatase n=1 Tax=Biformimicrobium ophioploci TaxID=3036711 RepID=A0ABQ6M029_9GAMM|nr:phosphatase PAP2 family protein [Microbulbifer sp. NKW57]GMG87664.1 phosphatase PAP2 family protein [Microbulbifer sp. NKW57]
MAVRAFRLFKVLLLALVFAPLATSAADDIERAGDHLQILLPATALGMTVWNKDWEGSRQFMHSMAANLLVTHGLKRAVNKLKPNGEQAQSFPSGHTSVAFQGAAFVHRRYGLRKAVPAYVAAAFVGYSRVRSDHHYPEDVVAGAALGILSSFYFSSPYNGVSISTGYSEDGLTLSLTADF